MDLPLDLIEDLPDARRAVKDWLPADDRDVTNGLVVLRDDDNGPCCIRHGAMHRVHPTEPIYRCSEYRCGVGCRMATSEKLRQVIQAINAMDAMGYRDPLASF